MEEYTSDPYDQPQIPSSTPYDQPQIPSSTPYDQPQIPTGYGRQPSGIPMQQPPPQQPQPPLFQQQYPAQSNLNYQQPPPAVKPVKQTAQQAFHPQTMPNQFHAQPTSYQPPLAMAGQFPPQNTASVQGFPVPGLAQMQQTEGWSSGLLDCCKDPLNALVTVLLPCITFGQVAEIADSGHTSCGTSGFLYCCIAYFIGCPCILSCTYRSKLRAMFGIIESPAPDCIVHFLCECCALCQEHRELRSRGFDPSIGWKGNLAKMQRMQQQVLMTPPANQNMMGY